MSRFLGFSHVFFLGEFHILYYIYIILAKIMTIYSDFLGRLIFRSSYTCRYTVNTITILLRNQQSKTVFDVNLLAW